MSGIAEHRRLMEDFVRGIVSPPDFVERYMGLWKRGDGPAGAEGDTLDMVFTACDQYGEPPDESIGQLDGRQLRSVVGVHLAYLDLGR